MARSVGNLNQGDLPMEWDPDNNAAHRYWITPEPVQTAHDKRMYEYAEILSKRTGRPAADFWPPNPDNKNIGPVKAYVDKLRAGANSRKSQPTRQEREKLEHSVDGVPYKQINRTSRDDEEWRI